MIEVAALDLSGLEVEAVVLPVRADGSGVTQAGRTLELELGEAAQQRLLAMGDLPVGAAVISAAGHERCQFVIHVVIQSHDEAIGPSGVRRALVNALRRAEEWAITSVALPAVGVGAGNLDAEEAARIVGSVVAEHGASLGAEGRILLLASDDYQRTVFDRLKISLESGAPDS